MSTLTKEQIERLTPEQQQLLAAMELRRVANRERLLKLARGSKMRLGVQGAYLAVVMAVVILLAMCSHLKAALVVAIASLVGAMSGQIIATDRRFDALLKLYETEDDDAA